MKIALCICPQWSNGTPSYALGSLKSHIDNPNVQVKQFDLNIGTSLYYLKNGKTIQQLSDWENDKPWNERKNVVEEVIPYFREYWEEYINELSTYDVVAFTVYTSNIVITDYIARYIKEKNKHTQIWYGGPFCWYTKSGGLEESGMYREYVDVGCSSNEGEFVIKDLVDKWVSDGHYENIRGIYRWDKRLPSFPTTLKRGRSGRTPVFNGVVVPQNLNTLKTPCWDKHILEDYSELCKYAKQEVRLPIQASRGCTFKCTFCQETRLYRYKDFEKVILEMKDLYSKYGVESFWFTDSLVNGSMKKFTEFVDKLDKENMNLSWGGYFRTHKKMDSELLKKAVGCGLNMMRVGTENGVNKILALMEKGQTADDVSHFLKSAYESKVRFYANWIPGYPKENYMDFLLQLKFLYDNQKYFHNNGILNLMQSTDIMDSTPLDVYRDDFNVFKKEQILNSWVTKDYKSFLVVRHLKGFLIHTFLRALKFSKNLEGKAPYLNDGPFKSMSKVKNLTLEYNKNYDEEFVMSDFLNYKEKTDIKSIMKNEIEQVIKCFAWTIHSVSDNYNIDFKYIDRFFGYNVFNSHFKLNLKMTDNRLSYDYKLFIDEEDNSFNQKYDIKEKNNITLNSIGTSQKVYDLYLDSLDYDKHSVNYKRVPLTNQY